MKTAEELLNMWRYGCDVPSPDHFAATSTKPISEVSIGRLDDGREVWAFGVPHRDWSFDGGPLHTSSWAWYLDRNDALRRARAEEYRYSSFAHAWTVHRPESLRECVEIEERVIRLADGATCTVFKYAVCKQGFRMHWRIGSDLKEAMHWQRHALWRLSGNPDKPWIERPDAENPKAEFPGIVHCNYGVCPRTSVPLLMYGVLCWDSYSHKFAAGAWFETLEQAESALEVAKKRFSEEQAYFQRNRDMKAATEEFYRVRRVEGELTSDPWYMAARTLVDPLIVAAYDQCFLEPPDSRGDDLDAYLRECAEVEAAAKTLHAAITEAYLQRAQACEERGIKTRVMALLEQWYSVCPLCGEKYAMDDFDTVLVTGELLITGCQCPSRGWEKHTSGAPVVIDQMHDAILLSPFRRDHLPELYGGQMHSMHSFTAISAVKLGERSLVQFVVISHNLCLRPALRIDTAAWLQLPHPGPDALAQSSFDPVWQRVALPAVQRERIRYAEKCVESGSMRKLAFQLGAESRRWYVDVEDSCGLRRFVIEPRDCTFPIQAGVLYYCTVDVEPPDNWRPRKPEHVRPFLAVPMTASRANAPQRFTEHRPTPRAPQGSRGLGTFADLFQAKPNS